MASGITSSNGQRVTPRNLCVAEEPGSLYSDENRTPPIGTHMQIISIDGGGYLGLSAAEFLRSMEVRFGANCTDRFDLFCGTSTGAIIALALASGMAGSEIVELYQTMGPRVFRSPSLDERALPLLRDLRAIPSSLHDNRPLEEALKSAFRDLTLGDLRAAGKRVLVTAFNVSAGRPTVFKTDHGPGLTMHDRYLVRDVAMASSAAPMYLPLVELTDPNSGVRERYCDGGVVSNSPALLGYAEAVSHLGQRPQDIAILSIGTPRENLAERPASLSRRQRTLKRGLWGWYLGKRIISVTIDAGAMAADTALKRVAEAAGTAYVRVPMVTPPGVGLDIATPEATQSLRQLGADVGRDSRIQRDVERFFIQPGAHNG